MGRVARVAGAVGGPVGHTVQVFVDKGKAIEGFTLVLNLYQIKLIW